jgi:hypothetical protein
VVVSTCHPPLHCLGAGQCHVTDPVATIPSYLLPADAGWVLQRCSLYCELLVKAFDRSAQVKSGFTYCDPTKPSCPAAC